MVNRCLTPEEMALEALKLMKENREKHYFPTLSKRQLKKALKVMSKLQEHEHHA